MDNYQRIARDNIDQLYAGLPPDLALRLPAHQNGERFTFNAFGAACALGPDGIHIDGRPAGGVLAILISLYALHARPDPCDDRSFVAFKELPGSMPYVGAFMSHTQQAVAPHVASLASVCKAVASVFDGEPIDEGDFGMVLSPLPKIRLKWIFYGEDEDFPATATCLYSKNAHLFLPTDALADVGEYTAKKILDLMTRSE